MTLDYISRIIDEKIAENNKKIVFTFYELKVDRDMSNEELKYFKKMAKIRLENLKYLVYETGQPYSYNNEDKFVENNEEIVAIKREENENERQDIKAKHTKIRHKRFNNRITRKK